MTEHDHLARLEELIGYGQRLFGMSTSQVEAMAWVVKTIREQQRENESLLLDRNELLAHYQRSTAEALGLRARIAELEAKVPEQLAELVIEKHRLRKALRTIAELQELNSVPILRIHQAQTIARAALAQKGDSK